MSTNDSTARGWARKLGLKAKKSRWRKNSADNRGGFMLLDPIRNTVIAGIRFDLTSDDVIEYCKLRTQA